MPKLSIGDLLGGLFPSKPSPSKPNPAIEGIFPSKPNPQVGNVLEGLFPSKPSPVKPNPAIEGIFPSNPNKQTGDIIEGLFPSNPNPPNLNVGSAMGNVIKPALPSEPKRDYIDPSIIARRGINPPRKLPPGIIRFNPVQYEDPLDMGGRMYRLKEKYGNQSPWEKVRRFLGKK